MKITSITKEELAVLISALQAHETNRTTLQIDLKRQLEKELRIRYNLKLKPLPKPKPKIIPKGSLVIIRFHNGGEITGSLLWNYHPRSSDRIRLCHDNHIVMIPTWRIKTIEQIILPWI